MARTREPDAALVALERQRQFALDCAHVELALKTEALGSCERAHEQLAADLDTAHGVQRALAAPGQRLSSEALRFAFHLGRAQSIALRASEDALEKSRAQIVQAQCGLAQRLEDIRIIERLRERRARARELDRRRRAQARLDELAIIKAWNGEDIWR